MGENKVELTDKMKGMMDTIEKMTVMELADLVKALEEKFGVSAAAAVAVAAPGAGAGAAAPAAEEKSTYTVVLVNAGASKIQVIKELRTITSLGLKEAKDLVDGAPKNIKEGATKEEAEKMADETFPNLPRWKKTVPEKMQAPVFQMNLEEQFLFGKKPPLSPKFHQ